MTGGNRDFTLLKIYLFIWLHQVFIKVSGIFIASFGVFCRGTQTITWASAVVGSSMCMLGSFWAWA